jgi:hypothetical protein
MTLTKLSNRKAQISRYVGRRDLFERNCACRQIRKKIVSVAAIVINFFVRRIYAEKTK